MGGASAVLATPSGRRAGALALLLAVLVAYYAAAERLPGLANRWDVAVLGVLLIPAIFATVYLVLPLWRARGLLPVALAVAFLTVVLTAADLDVAANFTKLAAVTLLGFWFLGYFDNVRWVALVAALIPWIDAYSVFFGPTRHIVEEQREIFTVMSIAFPIPGERSSANLGLPDFLFFALFLAATVRWGLRTHWTWLAMTASFGLTMLLAVGFDVAGLPALPLLSLAFLAVNADLVWDAIRRRRAPLDAGSTEPSDGRDEDVPVSSHAVPGTGVDAGARHGV